MTDASDLAALDLDVALEPVPADQVVEGSPQWGVADGGRTESFEWGVWEMTPGAMWDVEVAETFVVIAGEGTLTRTLDGLEQTTALSPGVVVTLIEGERTTWQVSSTLRKVWFCPV